MHGVEPLVLGVQHGDSCDDQKRREHEREGDGQGAACPGVKVPEPHRGLRGQRPWHRLPDGEGLLELLFGEPASVFDQVALHVADERDWAAEAAAAELEEVAHETGQRTSRRSGLGRVRTPLALRLHAQEGSTDRRAPTGVCAGVAGATVLRLTAVTQRRGLPPSDATVGPARRQRAGRSPNWRMRPPRASHVQ